MFFFLSSFLGMFFFLPFFLGFRNPKKKERKKTSQERKKEIKKFSTISTGKKGKTEVGDEDGERVQKNPEEIWICFHISSGFFLTPSPTSPPYANFTSAKNDLQYLKKVG